MGDVEHLSFGDGEWWDIRTRYTRGIHKAVTTASLASLHGVNYNGGSVDKPIVDVEDIKAALYRNIGQVDPCAIEDAYLLSGTIAFSFGPEVNLATISQVAQEIVEAVLTRMYELYNPQRAGVQQSANFSGKPSSVS